MPVAKTTNTCDDRLQCGTSGLLYAIVISVGLKLLTFTCNAAVARIVLPEVRGVCFNVDLFVTIALSISREAFRLTAARSEFSPAASPQAGALWRRHVTGLGWASALVGACLVSVFFGGYYVYAFSFPTHFEGVTTLSLSLWLWYVGALLEALAEPAYVVLYAGLHTRLRISVDSAALFVKAVTPVVLLLVLPSTYLQPQPLRVVWFLAIGGLAHGAVLFCCSTATVLLKQFVSWSDLTGSAMSWGDAMLRPLVTESICRFVTAEIAKLAMFGTTLSEQGAYGLVVHAASLVVRLVFRPVEDIMQSVWAQTPAKQLLDTLSVVTGAVLLPGCAIAALGPPFAAAAIRALYGPRWAASEAPTLLAWYCPVVALMALNGVMEAFIRATCTVPSAMSRYRDFMATVTIVGSLFSAAMVHQLSARGAILAEGACFAVRILYGVHWFRRLQNQGILVAAFSLLPPPRVLGIFLLGSVGGYVVTNTLRSANPFLLLAIGAADGMLCLSAIWLCERGWLRRSVNFARGRGT